MTISTKEMFLNNRVEMIEKILGIKFTGATIQDKEDFFKQYEQQLNNATGNILASMYDVYSEKLEVFQLCECDAVVAKTLEEAVEWYKGLTGLKDGDLYEYDEIETIPLDYKVQKSETDNELITVREILQEHWNGVPFIAVTTGGY